MVETGEGITRHDAAGIETAGFEGGREPEAPTAATSEHISESVIAQERSRKIGQKLSEIRGERAEKLKSDDSDFSGNLRNGLYWWRAIKRAVAGQVGNIKNYQEDRGRAETEVDIDTEFSAHQEAVRATVDQAAAAQNAKAQSGLDSEMAEFSQMINDRYRLPRKTGEERTVGEKLGDTIRNKVLSDSIPRNMVIGAVFRLAFRGATHVTGLGGAMVTGGVYGGISAGVKEYHRLRQKEAGFGGWEKSLETLDSDEDKVALMRSMMEDKGKFKSYFGGNAFEAYRFLGKYQQLSGTVEAGQGGPTGQVGQDKLRELYSEKKIGARALKQAGRGAVRGIAASGVGYGIAHSVQWLWEHVPHAEAGGEGPSSTGVVGTGQEHTTAGSLEPAHPGTAELASPTSDELPESIETANHETVMWRNDPTEGRLTYDLNESKFVEGPGHESLVEIEHGGDEKDVAKVLLKHLNDEALGKPVPEQQTEQFIKDISEKVEIKNGMAHISAHDINEAMEHAKMKVDPSNLMEHGGTRGTVTITTYAETPVEPEPVSQPSNDAVPTEQDSAAPPAKETEITPPPLGETQNALPVASNLKYDPETHKFVAGESVVKIVGHDADTHDVAKQISDAIKHDLVNDMTEDQKTVFDSSIAYWLEHHDHGSEKLRLGGRIVIPSSAINQALKDAWIDEADINPVPSSRWAPERQSGLPSGGSGKVAPIRVTRDGAAIIKDGGGAAEATTPADTNQMNAQPAGDGAPKPPDIAKNVPAIPKVPGTSNEAVVEVPDISKATDTSGEPVTTEGIPGWKKGIAVASVLALVAVAYNKKSKGKISRTVTRGFRGVKKIASEERDTLRKDLANRKASREYIKDEFRINTRDGESAFVTIEDNEDDENNDKWRIIGPNTEGSLLDRIKFPILMEKDGFVAPWSLEPKDIAKIEYEPLPPPVSPEPAAPEPTAPLAPPPPPPTPVAPPAPANADEAETVGNATEHIRVVDEPAAPVTPEKSKLTGGESIQACNDYLDGKFQEKVVEGGQIAKLNVSTPGYEGVWQILGRSRRAPDYPIEMQKVDDPDRKINFQLDQSHIDKITYEQQAPPPPPPVPAPDELLPPPPTPPPPMD